MSSQQQSNPKEFFNAKAAMYEEVTGGCTREVALKILDLPQLAGVFSPDANVLDNACGTGIVAEEILQRCTDKGVGAPSIACVDVAENMVEVARSKLSEAERLSFATMPGEKLDFPDGAFSHSITNLAIPFFSDGAEGAREVYRTLKPGGVAVITTFSYLGHVEAVLQPARSAVRPDLPKFEFPSSEGGLRAGDLEEGFKKAGFRSVSVFEEGAHHGAANVEGLSRLLGTKMPGLTDGWSDEEKGRFEAEVGRLVRKEAVPYKLGERDMVGIPLVAAVAVCTK